MKHDVLYQQKQAIQSIIICRFIPKMTAFFWPVANVEQVYEGKLIYITKKNNYDFAPGKILICHICRWSSYLQQILAVLI